MDNLIAGVVIALIVAFVVYRVRRKSPPSGGGLPGAGGGRPGGERPPENEK